MTPKLELAYEAPTTPTRMPLSLRQLLALTPEEMAERARHQTLRPGTQRRQARAAQKAKMSLISRN